MQYEFRRKTLKAMVVACLAASVLAHPRRKATGHVATTMTGDQLIAHTLNRLTFGPRSEEVELIRHIGVAQWIEQQLHPEAIPENPVLEAKLKPLESLQMSSVELVDEYPTAPILRAMTEGRLPLPVKPEKQALMRELAARAERKQNGEGAQPLATAGLQSSLDWHDIEPMSAEEQMEALAALPRARLRAIYVSAPAELQRKIQMLTSPVQVMNQDLTAAKLLRAIYSNRQLEEVLTDFWYNHFNVFLDKGPDRYFVASYERDVIRPNVLGSFHDLLLATAQSPAMLFYLDNWQSAGPGTRKRGLNENYARELMELHTLGVDGGYTQRDVTEVARCFTGWTIRAPQRGGGFEFNERMHDRGEKHVLGVTIPADGGMEDGLKVVDILATHPSTARFISKQLAIRFVSDEPPGGLVDRMAKKFLETGGDLRQVMRTMIDSPEFRDPANFRSKIKSPLELVASAVRAVDADVDYAFARQPLFNQLGEPLYRKQEPNGYPNVGAEWLNGGSLVARMNFATALASNKVAGMKVDLSSFAGDRGSMERRLLPGGVSAETERAIESAADSSSAAVALASPDFERR